MSKNHFTMLIGNTYRRKTIERLGSMLELILMLYTLNSFKRNQSSLILAINCQLKDLILGKHQNFDCYFNKKLNL
jgi:hypothetical protein